MFEQINKGPHRRFNPLTGEWVLVSPHRTQRPWQGKQEDVAGASRPEYDKDCYLCAGNQRSGGQQNPDYKKTFVFTNDFSALLSDTPPGSLDDDPLFKAVSEQGRCKVICFSPNHSLTIPDMEVIDIVKVVETWQNEYNDLGNAHGINYVQIFENKGAIMGCSNPHPHGQIWAQRSIPTEILKKTTSQRAFYEKEGASLLQSYVEQELQEGIRIVSENDSFVTLVPFWAVWPYEAMIVPKRHMSNIM